MLMALDAISPARVGPPVARMGAKWGASRMVGARGAGSQAVTPVYRGLQPGRDRVSAEPARRADPAADVEIRLHPIPTPDAKPYIIVVGPDGALWFCESGTAKIGRLDQSTGRFTEFATPTESSRPIGIIPGPDGNLWFCENAANQIGRITPQGAFSEFALP